MTPTDALRTSLREAIDEPIPSGGTDLDTRFSAAQVDALLLAVDSVEAAAVEGWTRKAVRALSERGGLQEMTAGSERLKFVSIEAYRAHCLAMADLWQARVPGTLSGSRLLAPVEPDVLGTPEGATTDLSRLTVYVEW